MSQRALFPSIIIKYVFHKFISFLILALYILTSLYLLVEFFERLDNLMAQHLSLWIIIKYLILRSPQVIFQILPVAVLMAILFTLGGMARDGELLAALTTGINLYQILIPLFALFLVLTFLSSLYHEFWMPELAQDSKILLAQIKGEKSLKKLKQGRIWLAGKNRRFFHIQFLDLEHKTLNGVTIFEIDQDFQLKGRWDIHTCSYENGLWHLQGVNRWDFIHGIPRLQTKVPKVVSWPESFSDFALLKTDPEEMGYRELKGYIKRLEEWGYKTTIQRTDLQFKWASPFICLIFGLLGIPFAIRMHKGVKYFSVGLSIMIAFTYWIIAHLGVSMAHAGLLPPIIGAWLGNALFGLLGFILLARIST